MRGIAHDLFGLNAPENKEAIVGMLGAEDIVIIDGIHELHPRHKHAVLDLILEITERVEHQLLAEHQFLIHFVIFQ